MPDAADTVVGPVILRVVPVMAVEPLAADAVSVPGMTPLTLDIVPATETAPVKVAVGVATVMALVEENVMVGEEVCRLIRVGVGGVGLGVRMLRVDADESFMAPVALSDSGPVDAAVRRKAPVGLKLLTVIAPPALKDAVEPELVMPMASGAERVRLFVGAAAAVLANTTGDGAADGAEKLIVEALLKVRAPDDCMLKAPVVAAVRPPEPMLKVALLEEPVAMLIVVAACAPMEAPTPTVMAPTEVTLKSLVAARAVVVLDDRARVDPVELISILPAVAILVVAPEPMAALKPVVVTASAVDAIVMAEPAAVMVSVLPADSDTGPLAEAATVAEATLTAVVEDIVTAPDVAETLAVLAVELSVIVPVEPRPMVEAESTVKGPTAALMDSEVGADMDMDVPEDKYAVVPA